MVLADVFALSDEEPPDRDHGPILLAAVLEVVEGARHVAVAVVAADVVHPLAVGAVRALDVVVEFLVLAGIDTLKDNIFVRLTESKVVLADIVGTSEVIDDSIGAADASVADSRQEPSYRREWGPGDAEREPGRFRVHPSQLWCCSFASSTHRITVWFKLERKKDLRMCR